tara:strand:+ start:38780 stop:39508 length:729 start_codon:yes stop_codon:yes gene_type:complete
MTNRALIIGDTCTDIFIYGACKRLCPDAPVPIFLPRETTRNAGMAANVAANLKELGIDSDLLCSAEKIEKTRYVDLQTNHMFLRVDTGEESIERIKGLTPELLQNYEVIVISDYNKGFLEEEDISFICETHDRVFLDTKKILGPWSSKAAFIKINEHEFKRTQHTLDNLDNMIITLGENGCRYGQNTFPVEKVEVKDMSGAGDTFLAGLVANYLETNDIRKAISFANACATKVVQKRGVNVI